MARRKAAKTPEIREETLERARAQASQDAASERAERRARVRKASTVREAGKPRRITRKDDENLTAQEIEERLAYPTKFVSEAELRSDYAYVLRDLRNMGLLAVALFVVLVGLAVFFIR